MTACVPYWQRPAKERPKPMRPSAMFRASEMLKMAIEIERAGLAFYEATADAAVEPGTRQVFQFMIGEERRHIEVFLQMEEPLEHYQLPETYPGELEAYIQALIQDRVFRGPDAGADQAQAVASPFHAIALAIGLEKDSILFYSAMKPIMRASEAEVIERVISEEQDHIRRLVALRASLERGPRSASP